MARVAGRGYSDPVPVARALGLWITLAACACSGRGEAVPGAVQLTGSGAPAPAPSVLTPIPVSPTVSPTVLVGPPPAPSVTTRRISRSEGGDGTRTEPRLVSLEGSGNWMRVRWRIEYTAGLEPVPTAFVEGRTLRIEAALRGRPLADAIWFRETWETTVTGLDAGEWDVVAARFHHVMELPSGAVDGAQPGVAEAEPRDLPSVRRWSPRQWPPRLSRAQRGPLPPPPPTSGLPRGPEVVDPWN